MVRYHVSGESADFRGLRSPGGTESDAADLAKLLVRFPASPESIVEFGFVTSLLGCSILIDFALLQRILFHVTEFYLDRLAAPVVAVLCYVEV